MHPSVMALLIMAILTTALPAQAYQEADLIRLLDSGRCDNCDLSGAELRGRKLDGASLRGSDLSGADLTDCNLRRADLTGADLTGADLRDARLSDADLSGSRLQGADLYGVDLSETKLAGADMRGVDLRHMDIDLALEFLDLTGVLLEGARFKDGVRCLGLPAKGGWGCAAEVQ